MPSGKLESNWLCQCDCGKELSVRRTSLYGSANSCGCLQREKARILCQTHPELKNGGRKHGLSKTKNYQKNRALQRDYGISKETYDKLLHTQCSLCAICGGAAKSKSLAVDHDHKTGEIRGLLCAACNIGLGMFKDSQDLLFAAAMYLLKLPENKCLLPQNKEQAQSVSHGNVAP